MGMGRRKEEKEEDVGDRGKARVRRESSALDLLEGRISGKGRGRRKNSREALVNLMQAALAEDESEVRKDVNQSRRQQREHNDGKIGQVSATGRAKERSEPVGDVKTVSGGGLKESSEMMRAAAETQGFEEEAGCSPSMQTVREKETGGTSLIDDNKIERREMAMELKHARLESAKSNERLSSQIAETNEKTLELEKVKLERSKLRYTVAELRTSLDTVKKASMSVLSQSRLQQVELQKKVELLIEERDAIEEAIGRLEQEHEEKEKRNARLQVKLSDAKLQKKDVSKKLREANSRATALKEEMKDQLKDAKKRIGKRDSKLREQMDINKKLTVQNKKQKKAIANITSSSEKQITDALDAASAAKRNTAESDTNLFDSKSKSQAAISTMTQKVNQQEEKIKELETSLRLMKQSNIEIAADSHRCRELVVFMKTELDKWRNASEGTSTVSAAEPEGKIEILRQELEAMSTAFEEELLDVTRQLEFSRLELSSQEDFRESLAITSAKMKVQDDQISKQDEMITTITRRADELQITVEELRAALEESQNQLEKEKQLQSESKAAADVQQSNAMRDLIESESQERLKEIGSRLGLAGDKISATHIASIDTELDRQLKQKEKLKVRIQQLEGELREKDEYVEQNLKSMRDDLMKISGVLSGMDSTD